MHHHHTYLVILSILSLFIQYLAMGGNSHRSLVASRVSSPPKIDGYLNDEEWKNAVPAGGFQQFDPEEGASPTEQTTVMVLYDDHGIYVGVMCYDSQPDLIVKKLTRRDRTSEADRFSVIIDSYHDHNTAFLFSGSVSGVQTDGVLSQDGRSYDIQWDAIWSYAAQINSKGWSGEFRIPFSALRFAKQDSEYVWGINFRRYIARKGETDEWVLVRRTEVPPGTISPVSTMGHLSGMVNIHPPLHITIMPYGVSKASYFGYSSPTSLRKEFIGTGGIDLKYGLSHNFTFDLTVNPDFGQVEVDQAVLNLTVFETYYPEKRPFFLEGSQIFSFGDFFDQRQLRLFYSRRIGKRPAQPFESFDPTYSLVESPATTTILSAGKLTGKTDNGLAIGLLTAVTEKENGFAENLLGHRIRVLFEPQASYNVLRLKQDVLGNSSIGFIATGGFQEFKSPIASGGFDWNFRSNDGMYVMDGYLAGSTLTVPSGNKLDGGTGRIGFGKLEGEHWLAATTYDYTTRNFQIDDIGFFNQPQEHGGYTQLLYKENFARSPLRRYSVTLQPDYRWNWDGINTLKSIEFGSSLEFTNFWFFVVNYIRHFRSFDDANRGIVGLYHRPEKNIFISTLQTDNRKSVVLSTHTGFENTTQGSRTFYNVLQFTLRPTSWIELSPGFTFIRTRNEEAWVFPLYTTDGYNLFGDRDIDQHDFFLRGTVTLTRNLTMQFYTQVFLAKGQYSNFRKLVGSEELITFDYFNSPGYTPTDFNEQTFNANFVMRWEFLPGSTFYLVWTQFRYGDVKIYDRSLSENFSHTFKLPMDNVLLTKISYWFSL